MTRPGWVAPATFGAAIAGALVSAWLTAAHYTSTRLLACPASGLVDCERVTTSAQATPLGIPVALLGVAWFAAMAALCAPAAWRADVAALRVTRVALACAGMTMVLWLIHAELFVIGAICLWCTSVHALAFVLFATILPYGGRAGA